MMKVERRTKFLDSCGIKLSDQDLFGPEKIDHLISCLDVALEEVSRKIDWGEHPDGRRRKPCIGQPLMLVGAPIGQYHCDGCGEMQVAGMSHLPPDEDYEESIGEWQDGYHEYGEDA